MVIPIEKVSTDDLKQVLKDLSEVARKGAMYSMKISLLTILFLWGSLASAADGGDETSMDDLFRQGMTALAMAHNPDLAGEKRAGLLNRAIGAFGIMLEKNPNLPRVHFELARTLFIRGDDLAAKRHFEIILEGSPPTPVVEDINHFLDAIRQRNPSITAQELLGDNRPDEALKELERLVGEHPDNLDILFMMGETALAMAHNPELSVDEREELLDESVVAFETMLEMEPELPRVNLELARAFFLKGEDSSAKKHLNHALTENPPLTVANNIDHFLNLIRQRKPWQIRVTASTLYDSNMGNGSGEDTITIWGLPFRLDGDGEEVKSGMGFALRVSGEYQYRLGKRQRLRVGGSLERKDWENHDFDSMTVEGHIGPHFSLDESNHISLLAAIRRHWKRSTDNPFLRDMGFRIETAHQINSRLGVNTQTYWYDRHYDSSKELDGAGGDIHAKISYAATPELQIEVSAGHGHDRPQEKKWRQTRKSLGLGFTAELPENFVMGFGAEVKEVWYEGKWYPYVEDGSPRRDRIETFRINAGHQRFTLLGFRPQLFLIIEKLATNAQIHGYKKTHGGVRFSRVF